MRVEGAGWPSPAVIVSDGGLRRPRLRRRHLVPVGVAYVVRTAPRGLVPDRQSVNDALALEIRNWLGGGASLAGIGPLSFPGFKALPILGGRFSMPPCRHSTL